MAGTDKGNAPLSIGGLARETGVKVETIRYYERIGLIDAAARTPGGNRVYDRADVRRLGFIRRSRELGFPLEDIRALIELAENQDSDCGSTREVTMRHLENVRGKIASLRRLERTLRELTQACSPGNQTSCPILDSLNPREK